MLNVTRDEVIKMYNEKFKPNRTNYTDFEAVDYANFLLSNVESVMAPGDLTLEQMHDDIVDFLNSADEEA